MTTPDKLEVSIWMFLYINPFFMLLDLELAIVNTPTPTPEKLPLDMSVNDPSPSAPPPSSLYPILPGNSSDAVASPHQPFPDPGEAVNVINPVANCRSEFNMLRVSNKYRIFFFFFVWVGEYFWLYIFFLY